MLNQSSTGLENSNRRPSQQVLNRSLNKIQLTNENIRSQPVSTTNNNYNNISVARSENLPTSLNRQNNMTRSTDLLKRREIFQSYDFSVKSFGLLCDRLHIGHSVPFECQKYGKRRLISKVIKLDPIDGRSMHFIDLNRQGKISKKRNTLQTKYSQLKGWDERSVIKKIVELKNTKVVVSFRSLECFIESDIRQPFKQELNEQNEYALLDEPKEDSPFNTKQNIDQRRKKKRRVTQMLNMSLLKYILEFSEEELRILFQQFVVVEQQLNDNEQMIDKLLFKFQEFEDYILNPQLNDQSLNVTQKENILQTLNSSSLSSLSSVVRSQFRGLDYSSIQFKGATFGKGFPSSIRIQKDEEVQVRFPSIEVYITNSNYKKQQLLTKHEIIELINSDFSILPNYANIVKEREYEKTETNQLVSKIPILPSSPKSLKQLSTTKKGSPQPKQSSKQFMMPSQISLDQFWGTPSRDVLYPLHFQGSNSEEHFHFSIAQCAKEKPLIDLIKLKYYKEQISNEDQIHISFFPSKVFLKERDSDEEGRVDITHNLNFGEFYNLASLSCSHDIISYLATKIELQEIVTENSNDSHKRYKLELNLPSQDIKRGAITLKRESIDNGLFRELQTHVNLEGKKLTLKISPPTFEVNFSLENKRKVVHAEIDKINEIIKAKFNFSYFLLS